MCKNIIQIDINIITSIFWDTINVNYNFIANLYGVNVYHGKKLTVIIFFVALEHKSFSIIFIVKIIPWICCYLNKKCNLILSLI